MLLSEWKLEEALEYKEQKGREEGEKIGLQKGEESKQQELIRAFGDILEPEVIAEKVKQPVEYVLQVLDEPAYVREEVAPYTAAKKE